MPRCSVTRRTSSATSPTSRCIVSTSSFFSRPMGLSSISGVMSPFMVPSTSSSIFAMTLTLELGVERVAEQLVELGAEGAEGAGERPVLLVEQAARGAGDLVDRVGDAGLEARLELVEGALDHIDVDGDVCRPERTGTDAQALTNRRHGIVGLGRRCARPLGRVPRARRGRRRHRRREPVPSGREWALRSSCHPPAAVAEPPPRALPVSDRGETSTFWRRPIARGLIEPLDECDSGVGWWAGPCARPTTPTSPCSACLWPCRRSPRPCPSRRRSRP